MVPNPPLRGGLLTHQPVGAATCELHLVDLAEGFEAAKLAIEVHDWRKQKDLTTPYSILDIAVPEGTWEKKINAIEDTKPDYW